jgi:hydroxyacylglutathione hydrolase
MLPGARHVPLAQLLDRMAEIDPATPVVVTCASGYRSSIAASVLRAHGFDDVSDLLGGFGACRAAGLVGQQPAGTTG